MSAGSPDLSVIVPSYGTRDATLACLGALARAQAAHPELASETIVVDNGSRDGSVEAIARAHPATRRLVLTRNRGFAVAANLGLRAARGRHMLLLNSDVEIETDVLVRGVRALDEKTDFGVLGVALRHRDGRPQRSVHPLPGLQSELLPEALLRLLRPGAFAPAAAGSPARAQSDSPIEVEAVRGAVFFVRGALLEKLGLLDESYFFFLEETDYCRRVQQAGYRVGYCPDVQATHRLGASSKRRASRATRIEYHRSLYRYLRRVRGRGVAGLVRAVRMLRGLVLLPALAAAAPFSRATRTRLAERTGLLLWHLRGCSGEPSFAEALAAESGLGEEARQA